MMLAALGILAYAASMMTHEALGHGAYCVLMGGHNVMLSAWNEGCSANPNGIQAAGPTVQFFAGLLAWFVLRRLPAAAARLRFFVWLYMTYSLLIASSYVAFSGVTEFGDAAVMIAHRHPHTVWRGVLIVFGSAVYFLCLRIAAAQLKRFAGLDGPGRLYRLVAIPYIAVGVFACCAGALNRTMGHGIAFGLAAAGSFGSGAGMWWLPELQRGLSGQTPATGVYIRWSTAWAVATALVVVAFLFFLGPGLK